MRGKHVEIRVQDEQRAWSKSDVRGALHEAVLDVVDVVKFDPYEEGSDLEAETVKLFFTCGLAEESRLRGR